MIKIIKLVPVFLLLIALTAFTNLDNSLNKNIIYKAYISGDMGKWISVIKVVESENPSSPDKKLELLNYYYGYTAYLISVKKYDLAQKYITKSEKIIEEILKLSPKNATVFAYKGSFIGFKIALSKFKAISLGPESLSNINKAYQLDPQNIQANVDKGNVYFHTPRLFGGNKKESLKLYQRGIKLLESSNNTENNWFYLNVLTLTARNHEYLEQYDQAKQLYEKILKIEPNYKWVKTELYPNLIAKMK